MILENNSFHPLQVWPVQWGFYNEMCYTNLRFTYLLTYSPHFTPFVLSGLRWLRLLRYLWQQLLLWMDNSADSTASSICRLYVLSFWCSLSMTSCIRSWVVLSSSSWAVNSLRRLSCRLIDLAVSPCRCCSDSNSISNSWIRCENINQSIHHKRYVNDSYMNCLKFVV